MLVIIYCLHAVLACFKTKIYSKIFRNNYRKTGYMRNGTEIANPFTKGVRLLECPLIGERTVFQFGHTVFCVMLSFTLFSENVVVLENREITTVSWNKIPRLTKQPEIREN